MRQTQFMSVSKAAIITILTENFEKMTRKNIFDVRKGGKACLHPMDRKIYLFGGMGNQMFYRMEKFCERTLEFEQIEHESISQKKFQKADLKLPFDLKKQSNSKMNLSPRYFGV